MHEKYMRKALLLAQTAYNEGEIPIGAVVVYKDSIIGKGYNQRHSSRKIADHAEIIAINKASEYLGSWNLSDCTLYVTVEPCPMCAGALIQSQCNTVVYGAKEPNSGSFGSVVDLSKYNYNHKINVISGICQKEGEQLMTDFFKALRNTKVKVKKVNESNFDEYLSIRKEVFVDEQKVPLEIEIDELDRLSLDHVTHIGAFKNDEMIATARLIKDDKNLRVGRVAVLKNHRKTGVGAHILEYAYKQATNNGFDALILGSQVSAIPFYEKSGYEVISDIYLDANIEHKDMKLSIKK